METMRTAQPVRYESDTLDVRPVAVVGALDDLDRNLLNLHEMVGVLFDRLDSVLVPIDEAEAEGATLVAAERRGSQIARRIDDAGRGAADATERLRVLLQRLDV